MKIIKLYFLFLPFLVFLNTQFVYSNDLQTKRLKELYENEYKQQLLIYGEGWKKIHPANSTQYHYIDFNIEKFKKEQALKDELLLNNIRNKQRLLQIKEKKLRLRTLNPVYKELNDHEVEALPEKITLITVPPVLNGLNIKVINKELVNNFNKLYKNTKRQSYCPACIDIPGKADDPFLGDDFLELGSSTISAGSLKISTGFKSKKECEITNEEKQRKIKLLNKIFIILYELKADTELFISKMPYECDRQQLVYLEEMAKGVVSLMKKLDTVDQGA